ncbi:hypothetical protein TrLO_g8202 [Triparma laevis f. longispina]|uniref:MYND-type domain-containing protein n=1 Tax=Triparma laevis f. longispina TaxID=1714387 RepID=A0A9W7DLM5_9STRA|nr:hypothetical protein TrLO_g8202 [Triparma laevis f. longispina]
MKLFGKKKSNSTNDATTTESSIFSDVVPSVEKKKQKIEDGETDGVPKESSLNAILGDDDLLKIPLEELTSKQRRLLRRKLARGDDGGDAKPVTKVEPESQPMVDQETTVQETEVKPFPTTAQTPSSAKKDSSISLKALDSNAKAKLLKKLSRKGGVNAPIYKTPKKVKDLSHLPPDERKRREDQRKKQAEAKERREGGEKGEHAHPLNSERRRANKRKPSEAMRIANAKKKRADEMTKDKKEYMKGGFEIRKGLKGRGDGGGRGGGRGDFGGRDCCIRRRHKYQEFEASPGSSSIATNVSSEKYSTKCVLNSGMCMNCGYPGCNRRTRFICSGSEEVKYCSKKHQKAHWAMHKKICTKLEKQEASSTSPPTPTSTPMPAESDCEHGIWPLSLRYLSWLTSADDFNDYFRNEFDGNERSYIRWKKSFDVLEIGTGGLGPNLLLEQQVLRITNSEDLVKLRALEKLCSPEFCDDPLLPTAVDRRNVKIGSASKIERLEACEALGVACHRSGDQADAKK